MQCNEFRNLIGADPGAATTAAGEHAATCPPCQAYAARLSASERLIAEALRFDVEALLGNHEFERRPNSGSRLKMVAGVAAALVAAIALWGLLRPGVSDALADDVIGHWHHEPDSWRVTNVRVSDASLSKALGDGLRLDVGKLAAVTYVRTCLFRGRLVPHLVVQGKAGPVMVLLLPDEAVASEEPVIMPEEGLRGVIFPHGSGSIAILGAGTESMLPLQQSLLDAVEWSI